MALVQILSPPILGRSDKLKAIRWPGSWVCELFEGRHFDREVVVLCVRWYLRFKLSYRDLVEMMAERGLSLAHTTIMLWNSNAAGTGLPDQPGHRGVSTRPT